MSSPDHVVAGAVVRPGAGRPEIRDGAVLVRDGHIVAVGTTAEVAAQASTGARRTDLPGCTIMPGLIDGAVRLSLSGGPTPYDDLPRDRGLVGELERRGPRRRRCARQDEGDQRAAGNREGHLGSESPDTHATGLPHRAALA